MASCIYVTDREMIEYHRINGANELNFWRPLSQTRMKKFHPGDLIFFLTKTDQPGRRREKGVIGYGEYVKSERLSLHTMWRKYGSKNGYATLDGLTSAITEYAKKVPEKISCLYIDHVVFFNDPVYPSDIGMELPLNLESYTYTYDGETDYTYKLLKAAEKVGLSYWAATMTENEAQEDWLKKDLRKNRVSVLQESIPHAELPKTVIKSGFSAMRTIMERDPEVRRVNENGQMYYKDVNNGGIIYYPCTIGRRDTEKLQSLIGYMMLWAKELSKENEDYRIVAVVKPEVKTYLEEHVEFPPEVGLTEAL